MFLININASLAFFGIIIASTKRYNFIAYTDYFRQKGFF